jgi:hypothetical protein
MVSGPQYVASEGEMRHVRGFRDQRLAFASFVGIQNK